MTSLQTAQTFLNLIFTNKINEALKLVAPDAKFISARPISHPAIPIYGTFVDHSGISDFFKTLGEMLEPGDFNITAAFSEGEHVAMCGKLRHVSRKTHRDFASEWALVCRVHSGKIVLYQFYEDTAALEAAIA
jgi:uncharacterized protein